MPDPGTNPPAPAPVLVVQAPGKLASLVQMLTPIAVLLLAGLVAWDRLHPAGETPSAHPLAVDGVKLGRSYAPVLATTLADGWDAAATAMEQGKTVTESQVALQSAWSASRVKAFTATVAPEFAKILPEGTEPTDPAKRAAVVQLWREFGAGLRKGK